MFRITSLTIALSALVAVAGPAQAFDGPALTRQQVQAQYFAARDAGKLPMTGEVGYVPPATSGPSQVSREQVLAVLRRDGPVPTGEGSIRMIATGEATSHEMDMTRAEVRAEYLHAKQDGTLPPTGLVGQVSLMEQHTLEDHAAGRVHTDKRHGAM